MFFETPSPAYFAPVVFPMLDADGKLVEKKFDIECRRLKASEHKALDEEVNSLQKKRNPQPYGGLINAVVKAWRVQVGEEIKTIPFSVKTLAEMEEIYPGFAFANAVAIYGSIAPTAPANHPAVKN
jgi:hypothetical protein